jgi:hypothetical protein
MGREVFMFFIIVGQCGPSNVGREFFKVAVKEIPLSRAKASSI